MMNRSRVRAACRRSLTRTLPAVVGLALSLGVAMPASAQLQWRTGVSERPARMTAETLRESLAEFSLRDGAAPRRVIVHFERALTAEDRAAFERTGVLLLSYLGENAYFASVNPALLDVGALTAVNELHAIEPIQTRYKLHPDLLAGIAQPWSVIRGEDEAADHIAGDAERPEALKAGPTVAVYVQFHKDVNLGGEGVAAIARHGGEVRSLVHAGNFAVVHLPLSAVNALAAEDVVQNIEPPLPKFSELNAENRVRTGADTIQAPPYNLSGTGVDVLIYDGGGVRTTHQDMSPRVISGDNDALSDHSTHVAGTVAGTGAASAGVEKGMAPGVRAIISYGFDVVGGLQPGFLYTEPGDFIADYTQAITTHGADISNNSIGTNTAPNGYDCNWEGDYGLMSELIDRMVRGTVTGSPFRVVWANGNERGGSARCGSTYRTTAPPACAKNHITVGALNSNDDSVASFTSWGPADDGRMKPDIAAPGCEVGGDGGVRSCSSSGDTAYSVKCGTSMASPTVCGLGAILLSDFRTLYPSRPDFRNSTLKTLLAHTAVDLDNPGPDNKYGYGSVRIVPAVELLRSGNFAENEVGQGGTVGVIVVVQPGDPELKVTLAWDDYQGTGNMIPQLVNDLDLVVRSPSNVRAYPWTLGGTANPGAPAVRTQENHVDNIEQVFVANPEPGAWLVEVRGTTVPQGPQSFSIAATPFLVNCSDRGIPSLDKTVYRCTGAVNLRVSDCGLNTSDAVVDTVTVSIASNSESGGESVLLTETAPQSAEFRGSINIDTADSAGVLRVSNGDTITMTYIDANDGMGGMGVTATATASVDCAGPVITNVAASNIQPRAATITFTTNEPATGGASFGTSCGSLPNSVNSTTRTTTHSIALSGLQTNTTYSFVVRGTDDAGNLTTNDNGGACFTFTTPAVPDFFTELFSTGTNDLDFRSNTFTPAPTIDGYTACSETISVLPIDPSLHPAIVFPGTQDNQFLQVNVAGGETVKLFGTAYSSFYVGSNGYITFTAGDTDSSETIADHFDTPRISGMFDDLDPAENGSVRVFQQTDSVVVTFLNIPQNGVSGDTNTFQIQMFFDGTIRISWLGISATDGLAGLSRGAGQDPDFTESDLSTYGPCGDRPPIAVNGSATTALATSVNVVLVATDDGVPGPLSYSVTSLPTNGSLRDGNGVVISSVPHALPAGDTTVRYAPRGLYQGTDSFQFRANDGGMPPTGGDSNAGTVSLTVGGPQPIHQFLVNDTNPGFTSEDQWAFGQPQGLGSRNRDPSAGFTGLNVLGYNLAGDYVNSMPERHTTSPAFNMTGITGSKVSFQRWLGIESASFDHAYLRVSNDGVNWTTVYSHTGASMNPSVWTPFTYDISAVADNQPNVRIRFTMGTTDTSVVYVGWNIDDIVISGLVPLTACNGDVNFDGVVDLADIAVVIQGWGLGAATVRDGDADFDASVGLSDIAVVVTNWATTCN